MWKNSYHWWLYCLNQQASAKASCQYMTWPNHLLECEIMINSQALEHDQLILPPQQRWLLFCRDLNFSKLLLYLQPLQLNHHLSCYCWDPNIPLLSNDVRSRIHWEMNWIHPEKIGSMYWNTRMLQPRWWM